MKKSNRITTAHRSCWKIFIRAARDGAHWQCIRSWPCTKAELVCYDVVWTIVLKAPQGRSKGSIGWARHASNLDFKFKAAKGSWWICFWSTQRGGVPFVLILDKHRFSIKTVTHIKDSLRLVKVRVHDLPQQHLQVKVLVKYCSGFRINPLLPATFYDVFTFFYTTFSFVYVMHMEHSFLEP